MDGLTIDRVDSFKKCAAPVGGLAASMPLNDQVQVKPSCINRRPFVHNTPKPPLVRACAIGGTDGSKHMLVTIDVKAHVDRPGCPMGALGARALCL